MLISTASLAQYSFVETNENSRENEELNKIKSDELSSSPTPAFVAFGQSANSFWAGATLAYNLESEGSDNIIGAGQVTLEAVRRFQNNPFFDLLIVGNLAKVTSSVGEDSSDDITEIIQSNQGLYVGISPIWVLNKKGIENESERRSNLDPMSDDFNNEDYDIFRLFLNGGYKLNGFQDVGVDKATINLSQFRLTTGIEYEGLHVTSGSPIHISTEFIFTTFSEEKYNAVFAEEKSNIFAWESTAIIPIGKEIGVMGKYTLSNLSDNVFQVGIVLRNLTTN